MKRCISMEWMWFLQFLFFELLWLAAVEIYNWCTSSAWSCTSQDHGVTRKKYVLWGAPRWCRAILVTLGWWLWYSVVTAASTTSSSYLFCCIQFVFTFLQLGATVRLNLHWAEDHGQWLEPISYRIIAVTGYIWMLLEVDLSLKYIEILIILLHAHTLSRNSASYKLFFCETTMPKENVHHAVQCYWFLEDSTGGQEYEPILIFVLQLTQIRT